MDHQRKKRGENWSDEDKEILRQLISESAHIIESKCTKTTTNLLKAKEWENIQNILNEVTGKSRAVMEIKLAWKRMKLADKANLSKYRQQYYNRGSYEKPSSPQEDQAIKAIAPHDFVIEVNNYYSDAVRFCDSTLKQNDAFRVPSCTVGTPIITDVPEALSENTVEQGVTDAATNTPKWRTQKALKRRKDTILMRNSIVESNIKYKKRNLEILETEHSYNLKIAKLKIRKLELEIELLESKKDIKERCPHVPDEEPNIIIV